MKTIARRTKRTTLESIYDRRSVIEWDSNKIVFVIDSDKVGVLLHLTEEEFVIYHPTYKSFYIGYKKDWDII